MSASYRLVVRDVNGDKHYAYYARKAEAVKDAKRLGSREKANGVYDRDGRGWVVLKDGVEVFEYVVS